ncbi:acetoacetyl-CoA synthetase, partial [Mytilus galloprovincialis]
WTILRGFRLVSFTCCYTSISDRVLLKSDQPKIYKICFTGKSEKMSRCGNKRLPLFWDINIQRLDFVIKMSELHAAFTRKYMADTETYKEFHQWSCDNYSEFWEEVFKFTDIIYSQPYSQVVDKEKNIADIPEWFSGCHLNFTENILRYNDDRVAVFATGEGLGVSKMSFRELRESVTRYVTALKKMGVQKGDRVVGYIPNCCEALEAMLAVASIGAVWSSTSPDFGVQGVLDRFTQIRPKVIFSVNAVWYNGKIHNHLDKLAQVVQGLPELEKVVVIPFVPDALFDLSNIKNGCALKDFLPNSDEVTELKFEQVPFNHPLFIMYSSGTTGAPKCMVHSVGGTLLKHMEEHVIQSDMDRDDIMLYYTTVGWMMWNWLVSVLAVGSAIVLYDGSPLVPKDTVLWDLIDEIGITFLGTSAKWLAVMEDRGLKPGEYDNKVSCIIMYLIVSKHLTNFHKHQKPGKDPQKDPESEQTQTVIKDEKQHGLFPYYDDLLHTTVLDKMVLDNLISRCVLMIEDREEIIKPTTQSERNRVLLDILTVRPYGTFHVLKDVLQESYPDNSDIEGLVRRMHYTESFDEHIDCQDIIFHKHSVKLQKNYMVLVHDSDCKTDIVDHLFEAGVLNTEDIEDICNSSLSRQDSNRILYNKLFRKGEDAYKHLLKALEHGQYNELASVVEKTEVPEHDIQRCKIGMLKLRQRQKEKGKH